MTDDYRGRMITIPRSDCWIQARSGAERGRAQRHDVAAEQRAQGAADLEPRKRPAFDAHAARRDRVADAVGVRLGVDDGVGGPELMQPVDVAIADDGLAVLDGPLFRATVEVDRCREHGVAFDGVEEQCVPIEKAAKT